MTAFRNSRSQPPSGSSRQNVLRLPKEGMVSDSSFLVPVLESSRGETFEDTVPVRWPRRWRRDRAASAGLRGGVAPRRGAVAVPELRAVGHYIARAAGRARRPQARPAPHPLHDVAAEPDG